MGTARSINDIINDNFYIKESLIINDSSQNRRNCGKTCGKVGISTEVADQRAQLLIDKFQAPQCRLFFLKCIYHLPEAKIQQAIEASMRPGIRSRIRYFVTIAKKELELQGY